MIDPVRVGVVGCGYWGPNLVRNLHESPDSEPAWACDLQSDNLRKIARRFPSVRTTSELDDLLGDESLDAVAIATPVGTHHAIALAALRAGKHVLVEKPLAGSSAEARELIAEAKARNLVLMPGHTFLYSPPVLMIRDLIASGELGDIYFVSTTRVNLGLHQADVSVVWDLGPHDFSMLRFWLDAMPERASAMARSCIIAGTPDVAFINLQFPQGTVAQVELAWLAPSKLRRTVIVGSRKMVVYDDTSTEPVRVFDSGVIQDPQTFGEYRLTYRTGEIVSPHVDVTEPLQLELNDFCDAVRNGAEPRSSAEIGLAVVEIAEAVDTSLASGGVSVAVSEAVGAASE